MVHQDVRGEPEERTLYTSAGGELVPVVHSTKYDLCQKYTGLYEFFRYDQCIYLSVLRYPYSLYFVYEYEIQ